MRRPLNDFAALSIWSGFLIGVLLLMPGCNQDSPVAGEQVVRPVKAMVVGEFVDQTGREYFGRVRPDREVELAFQVAGQLIERSVKTGDEVREGDILAKLDPRDYEYQLAIDTAEELRTKNELDRVLAAQAQNAVSEIEVIRSQASYDTAVAVRSISAKALDDTVLRAPFSGRIARLYVDNFQDVAARDAILSLQDISNVEIVISIPEQVIATGTRESLKRFTAAFDAIPSEVFDLELKEFSTDADVATQTFTVRFVMPQPEADGVNVIPGMSARVMVYHEGEVAGEQESFIIPGAAILELEPGKPLVWVIDSETMAVSSRAVTVGEFLPESAVEVGGGLKAGDVIAISGVHHLREGMKVRFLEALEGEGNNQ